VPSTITKKNKIKSEAKASPFVTLHTTPKQYVVAGICSLSLIAFILSCRLSIANTSYTNSEENSLTEKLLGDTRLAISGKLYSQADVYFHRGVPHEKQHAFESNPFQLIHNVVSPAKPSHLSGATDIQEIMPWLDMSIRSNPQNLDSYLVAAFWLSSEAQLNDQALQLLNRAQRNIPYSYEVQLAKGRIFLHTGEYNLARQAFSASLAFWNEAADQTSEGDLLDKSQALLYRALLYENSGMTAEAISDLRAMLMIGPENPLMQKRMLNLQKGKATAPAAHDLLASILNKQDKQSRKCEHEDHNHQEHEHSNESEHGAHKENTCNQQHN